MGLFRQSMQHVGRKNCTSKNEKGGVKVAAFITLARSHQVLLTRAATNALLIVALFTIPVVTGTSQAHTTQYSLLTSFSSRQLLPCFCSMDTFSPNTLARRGFIGFTSHIGAFQAWAESCSKSHESRIMFAMCVQIWAPFE